MNKSRAAFLLSVKELARYRTRCTDSLYMWTLTLPIPVSSAEAKDMWNHFLTLAHQKWPNLRGLRVFELQRSGRVHVHFLTHVWLDARDVRALAEQAGWGRTNATQIAEEAAGPYMTKEFRRRAPSMKGWRIWDGFGKWTWTKVVDVVIDSPFSRIYKACKTCFGWEGNYDFFRRMRKVNVILRRTIVEGWPEGLGPGGRPYSDFGLMAILGYVRGPGVFV